MIESIVLENFKGFDKHRIELKKFSVIVGRNNAGKSSLIEAMRIVATICKKLPSHKFVQRPSWCGGGGQSATGIVTTMEDVGLGADTIFHKYREPPARIEANFSNDARLEVFLGPSADVYAEATNPLGILVSTRTLAKRCEFTEIGILPQISPLESLERVLRKPYVQQCIESHLSSRHFRNQIRYFPQYFDSFKTLFEQTWEGVRISDFDSFEASHEDSLYLLLSEEGFVAEASDFGHGLQMWLQIAWFLARSSSESTIVLDEPDVYIHPDQQPKMINALRGRFDQCIVSTHSSRIIDECDESEVLRFHRQLQVSQHGVDKSTYDEQVDQALAKLRCKSQENSQVKSALRLKVVLQDEAFIQVNDEAGNAVLDLGPGIEGESSELMLPAQKLEVTLSQLDHVDIYVNGRSVDIESLSVANGTFVLDLNEYEC